jgi:hypothetical protein
MDAMTGTISAKMQLWGRFYLGQFTSNRTAKKLSLPNVPREASQVANLTALCRHVLEPVEARLVCDLYILSGYRCPTLNRLLGGTADSQHLLGEAADIHTGTVAAHDAAFTLAACDDIPFDRPSLVHRQLTGGGLASYLHVSHRRMGPNPRVVETVLIGGGGHTRIPGIRPYADMRTPVAA